MERPRDRATTGRILGAVEAEWVARYGTATGGALHDAFLEAFDPAGAAEASPRR